MKTRTIISILWLIFAVLFFILAGLHKAKSKKIIPTFEMIEIPDGITLGFGDTSLREILENFACEFNKYIAEQNESNRTANLYAFYGYFLAGSTALVSLVFESWEYVSALLSKLVLLVKSRKTSKNNK